MTKAIEFLPVHMGSLLRSMRKQRGLTQAEFAEIIGIAQKNISLQETCLVNIKTFDNYASKLGYKVTVLVEDINVTQKKRNVKRYQNQTLAAKELKTVSNQLEKIRQKLANQPINKAPELFTTNNI